MILHGASLPITDEVVGTAKLDDFNIFVEPYTDLLAIADVPAITQKTMQQNLFTDAFTQWLQFQKNTERGDHAAALEPLDTPKDQETGLKIREGIAQMMQELVRQSEAHAVNHDILLKELKELKQELTVLQCVLQVSWFGGNTQRCWWCTK